MRQQLAAAASSAKQGQRNQVQHAPMLMMSVTGTMACIHKCHQLLDAAVNSLLVSASPLK